MIRKGKLFLIMSLFTLALSSCKVGNPYKPDENKVRVRYELNGGKLNNDDASTYINHAYDFPEGKDGIKIYDPLSDAFDGLNNVVNDGLVVEGWYTKLLENGQVDPSSKWDFNTDLMTKEGLTLYANWKKSVTFTFDIYYVNEQGEEIKLESRASNAGSKFNNKEAKLADEGDYKYTFINFTNSNGEVVDNTFKHPGDEENPAYKLYANFIKDTVEYQVVRTATQLKTAIKNRKNVYLANDIDFAGAELSFANYKECKFNGAGHSISNFIIPTFESNDLLTDDLISGEKGYTIYFSLFNEIENCTFENLTISGFEANLEAKSNRPKQLYITALSKTLKNSTLNNVVIEGKYSYVKGVASNAKFNEEYTSNYAVVEEGNTISTDSTISFTKKNN